MKYYPSETTFFFDEYIYPNLIEYLKRAQSEIRICMAWLNDRDIFNLVLEALDRGIDIDINVNYNPSSNENNSTVELSKYIEKGGKISFITKKSADMLRIMHNKFCIIDKELVLTGSYNWSKSAQKNHENMVAIRSQEVAQGFLEQFQLIKKNASKDKSTVVYTPQRGDNYLQKVKSFFQEIEKNQKNQLFKTNKQTENTRKKAKEEAVNFFNSL